MAVRQSDRLRRRASDVVADSNGIQEEKVGVTMVVQGDPSGKRILRDRRGIELMMECEEDALTPAQIKANHEAKEAHSLAMRQIRAAHEGRLSFVRGTPVIHDRPIIVQTVHPKVVPNQSVNMNARNVQVPPRQQVTVSFPSAQNRQMNPAYGALTAASKTAMMPQQLMVSNSDSSQHLTYILGPSKQTIPVGRVAAQPRKQVYPGDVHTNEVINVSGTYGLGVKRHFPPYESPKESEAAFKRQKKAKTQQMDSHGNWVSLDDYYYGKMEGNAYYTEETGEYRFKCWYCNKMLYNNIKAMMHLQSHIDSEKQHNLDLSDLTQCKHCYKQFDTPFEMQTHIERVHLSNSNVLMCRICEKDHETNNALSAHMKQNHGSCEMPYICQLCFFRSSMYGDVVDHFKKKHDSSPNLLCLYCLKVYKIKFVANGWGITQNFYHHLVKHQSKNRSKKCSCCKLSFITPQEVKIHKKNDHAPNSRATCMTLNSKGSSQEPVMIKLPQRNSGGVKSLNAPAVVKNLDLGRLRIPSYASNFHCFECKGSMFNPDHFKKYTECSMCRYATSCSSAYANHMMSFHGGRGMLSVFVTVPRERPLETRRYCLCGFSSQYGNKIANHMVFCYKRTCYSQKPEPYKEVEFEEREMDPRRRPGASILDALGLIKKQTAKRSADDSATAEALLSQFEKESFVGMTNMSIAQVLSDNNKEEGSLDSDDYEVEEEIPTDDDDDDYVPGRFRHSPQKFRNSRRSGSMLVKLNFNKGRNKNIKSEPKDEVSLSGTPSSDNSREATAAQFGTSQITASSFDESASMESKDSSQSDGAKNIVQSESQEPATAEHVVESEPKEAADDNDSLPTEEISKTSENEKTSEESPPKTESETSQDRTDKEDNGVGDSLPEGDNPSDKNAAEKMECQESEIEGSPDIDDRLQASELAESSAPTTDSNKDSLSESVSNTDLPMEVEEENSTESRADKESKMTEEEEPEVKKDIDDEEQAEELSEDLPEEKETSNETDAPEEESHQGKEETLTAEEEEANTANEERETFENRETEDVPESEVSVEKQEKADELEKTESEETVEKENISETEETIEERETCETKETSEEQETCETRETIDEQEICETKETTEEQETCETKETSEEQDTCETEETREKEETQDVEETSEKDPEAATEEDMDTLAGSEDAAMATDVAEEQLKGGNSQLSEDIDSSQDIPEESEQPKSPVQKTESENPKSPVQKTESENTRSSSGESSRRELPLTGTPTKDRLDKQYTQSPGWAAKRHSSGDNSKEGSRRDSYESSDKSGNFEQRHHSRSSYDKSDKRQSSSGSYHRERSYDSGHHSNRHDRDRDDKYRYHSSGRSDERGYSSRDHGRYDDRGHGSRDQGSHGNRDRYDRDNRHHDNRHHERGYRRDSQGQGNWQGRSSGGSGYYGNQRRDYH